MYTKWDTNNMGYQWNMHWDALGILHWEILGIQWEANNNGDVFLVFCGKCSISMGTWRGCRRQIVRCNVYIIVYIYKIIYIWVAFLLVPNILNGLQCWMNICIHCTCSKHADHLNSDSLLSQMLWGFASLEYVFRH